MEMLDGFVLLAPFALGLLVLLLGFAGCSVDRSGLVATAPVRFEVALEADLVPAGASLRAFVFIASESGGATTPPLVSSHGDPADVRGGTLVLDDFDPVSLPVGAATLTCEVFERDPGTVPPGGTPPLVASVTPCRLEVTESAGLSVRFENRPGEGVFDGCEVLR